MLSETMILKKKVCVPQLMYCFDYEHHRAWRTLTLQHEAVDRPADSEFVAVIAREVVLFTCYISLSRMLWSTLACEPMPLV